MWYKTSFAFVFLCFLALAANAQNVSYTYDARNDINQCKQYLTMLDNLSETLKQSEILTKTKNLLELADKALSKVNSKLNEISYVEMIIRRQVYMVRSYSTYISNVKNMKYLSTSEIQSFESSLQLFISDSEKLLDMAQNILSDDFFKMSDSERISQLRDIDTRISSTQTAMDIYYSDLSAKNQAANIRQTFKSF